MCVRMTEIKLQFTVVKLVCLFLLLEQHIKVSQALSHRAKAPTGQMAPSDMVAVLL